MRRLTVITIFLLVLNLFGKAQQPADSVQMKYVYSIEDALKKAKKEKKPIFFNCFADWALPCHGMNQFVFNNKEFADYMDKNFVNLFVEMVATPEGKVLADKYKVVTFAQYLVLDESGDVILRIVGGSKLPEFQEKLAMALNPKTTLPGMQKRFEKGERNVKFLRDYAEILRDADMGNEYDIVKKEFLNQLKESDLCKKENWKIVSREAMQVKDEMFQFMVKHKADFAKNIGEEAINKRIARAYTLEVYPYASGQKAYDQAEFEKITGQFSALGMPEESQLFIVSDLGRYRGERQYDRMLDLLEEKYTGLDNEVLPALNLALSKIRDFSPAQKERMAAYLKEQMEKAPAGTVKHYKAAIEEVLNFAGILFENGTFAEILAKASQENKPVFLDCYTTWCGPCRTMSDKVFVTKPVGDLFNKRFINAKIDMEKGEGIELAKKYSVSSYPTFLILDGEGNLVHRVIGAASGEVFIEKMLRGLNRETAYAAVKARYDSGERSIELMPNYFRAMQDAGELPNAGKVITDYLAGLTLEQRCQKASWDLFTEHIKNYKDPLFADFLKNKPAYEKALGEQEVYQKIERTYFPVLLGHLSEPLKKEDLDGIRENLKVTGLSETSTLVYLQKLISLHEQKNYDQMLSVFENDVVRIEDPRDRLNIDVLLVKLLAGAPAEQKQKALSYAEKCLQNADQRAVNKYKELIQALAVEKQ